MSEFFIPKTVAECRAAIEDLHAMSPGWIGPRRELDAGIRRAEDRLEKALAREERARLREERDAEKARLRAERASKRSEEPPRSVACARRPITAPGSPADNGERA